MIGFYFVRMRQFKAAECALKALKKFDPENPMTLRLEKELSPPSLWDRLKGFGRQW
jgi:hypothetical protein